MLRIFVLGTFWVERDGNPIPESAWTRRKAKSLLKLLALRTPHQLHKEQVLELLWPELDVEAALNNFYRTLHLLRHSLEPDLTKAGASRFLSLREDVLRLASVAGEEIWIDLEAFESRLQQARTESTRAIPLLEEAVNLYRGDLLEEDLGEEWTQATREVLRCSFAQALFSLGAAYRQNKAYEAAIATGQRLVAQNPTDEAAQRELMLSYALAGRVPEALGQYQQCREVLANQLGIEPSSETSELYHLIESGQLEITRPQTTSSNGPTNITTSNGLKPGSLPLALTPLSGREAEIAEVSTLLQQPDVRLLTLTGPGGTGKTRLSLAVAEALKSAFDGQVYFVALAAIPDPAFVLAALAQTLGVPEVSGQPWLANIISHLRQQRLLVVLDNFEQVIAAGSEVAQLLEALPGLKVLTTSRVVLRVYGEYEYSVPPLATPDPAWLDAPMPSLEAVANYPSITLFLERAKAVKPDFELNKDNAPVIAELCARLEGLPLALELAATRSKLISPQRMLTLLGTGSGKERLELLKGGARNLPPRQQTIRDAIKWSYELLAAPEQVLFRRLAVFRRGGRLEAAETIGGLNVLDGLSVLVDSSLVQQFEGTDGHTRFDMLETIREYALEQLEASGEEQELRRQHAAYFLGLAEEIEPKLRGNEQLIWLERLNAEHDNFRGALNWSITQGNDLETGVRLAVALGSFWILKGHWGEGRKLLEKALDSASSLPPSLRAKTLHRVGTLFYYQSEYGWATGLLSQSLALRRELNDQQGVGMSLNAIGIIATYQGRYSEAIPLLEEALAIWKATNDQRGLALTLNNLGYTAQNQGDFTKARTLQEQNLALRRELKDNYGEATALNNLGYIELYEGHYQPAETLFKQGLTLRRELGDRHGIGYSLSNLGRAAAYQGRYSEALALLKECLTLRYDLGDKEGIANGIEGLLIVAAALGQAERAARLASASQNLRETIEAARPPAEQPYYALALSAAKARLEAPKFEAFFSPANQLTG